MGARINRLKNFIKRVKLSFQTVNIWTEAKDYIRDTLNAGEIAEVLDSSSTGYYFSSCGDVDVVERQLLKEFFVVRTETGAEFTIAQQYEDLRTGAEGEELSIYGLEGELIYSKKFTASRRLVTSQDNK